jgi:hypothetical protein
MIRARFEANHDDPRPINWPIKHPYWVTGFSLDESHATIVAYADDEAEILANWPEANNIDSDEVDEYSFSSRFPQPTWFSPNGEQNDEHE